jgi:diaminopimelate epimerase
VTVRALAFVKGHGTENDFVVLPDLDGALDLTPALVRRLCDRRAGIGADGVLRVVRSAAVPEAAAPEAAGPGAAVPKAAAPEAAGLAGAAEFFMDYRNADGSVAEMCGNGVRVYARYLVDAGLVGPGALRLATRGGVKLVEVGTGDGPVSVDMGPAVVSDQPLLVDGVPATAISMGNPHAVLPVPSLAALGVLDPDRKDVNVEYVQPVAPLHIAMRVHERGVGETRSCGTGACAAVVAHSLWYDVARDASYEIDVPGGRLVGRWREDGHVVLSGPAVLVAEGTVRGDWLGGH